MCIVLVSNAISRVTLDKRAGWPSKLASLEVGRGTRKKRAVGGQPIPDSQFLYFVLLETYETKRISKRILTLLPGCTSRHFSLECKYSLFCSSSSFHSPLPSPRSRNHQRRIHHTEINRIVGTRFVETLARNEIPLRVKAKKLLVEIT